MPLLTFTVKKDELLAKTKLKTIRFNSPYWAKLARRNDEFEKKLFHIWWNNPRFLRRDNRVYKMGIARWSEYYTLHGYDMTDALAKEDGFETKYGLHVELAKRNNIEVTEVLAHRWTVVGFQWRFGPFTKEQSARICWDSLLELQNQAVAVEDRCPRCGLIGVPEEDTSGEKVVAFYRCQVCEKTWG
jgi:hypothetical protein